MKNLNHLVSLLQEGYTTVAVAFSADRSAPVQPQDGSIRAPWAQDRAYPPNAGEKLYTYKCQFKDVKVGDLVIVPPSSEGKLPSIATVREVHSEPQLNFESGVEYKWLVGIVDTQAYADIIEKEKKMMSVLREAEKQKQRKELLDAYQLSLPSDPESRKLFDEARLIGGQILKG